MFLLSWAIRVDEVLDDISMELIEPLTIEDMKMHYYPWNIIIKAPRPHGFPSDIFQSYDNDS